MSRLRRLGPAHDGVAAVEFALIAPVLLVGVMGVFDLGHTMYTAALLEGAIQKSARDATIEGADAYSSNLDQRVAKIVRDVVPHATLAFERKSYASFSDARQPEDFTDGNTNGICDNGEPFEDVNGNATWDDDRGRSGNGGARDAVLYEVTVTYERLFPIAGFVGQSDDFTLVTQTVLRNQPYGLQGAFTPTIRRCT